MQIIGNWKTERTGFAQFHYSLHGRALSSTSMHETVQITGDFISVKIQVLDFASKVHKPKHT